MSKLEQIYNLIKENLQKIELFKLIDDEYTQITINDLEDKNIKLKKLLSNLKGEING